MLRPSTWLLLASLALAQGLSVARPSTFDLERRQNAPCPSSCALWYGFIDACRGRNGGDRELGNCLCQPAARASMPSCLECSYGDKKMGSDTIDDAELDELDRLDSITNDGELQGALRGIEGLCRRYFDNSASFAPPDLDVDTPATPTEADPSEANASMSASSRQRSSAAPLRLGLFTTLLMTSLVFLILVNI